jgi:hypothetical protein
LQGINRFDCDSPQFNYLSQINQKSFAPSSEAMTENTLLEFSAPNINNIRIGPTIDHEFEIKPSLINMVQADLFSEKVTMVLLQ